MAHYSFLKDLDASKKGVEVAAKIAVELFGGDIKELGKKDQILGDFSVGSLNVEVKYDLYAKKSGNLCFEISNGKGPTGIFKTLSDRVFYVVPHEDTGAFYVFVFNRAKLVSWLEAEENKKWWQEKNGGDGRKFKMRLVKITDVVNIDLCDTMKVVTNA